MNYFKEKYISKIDRNDWRVAPILQDDLKSLPPCLIALAGCNPLRDEDLAYSEKLRKAGKKVEVLTFVGQIHGFLTMGTKISDAYRLLKLVSNKIKNLLNKTFHKK